MRVSINITRVLYEKRFLFLKLLKHLHKITLKHYSYYYVVFFWTMQRQDQILRWQDSWLTTRSKPLLAGLG